jgi:hypothetical protein
MRFTLAGAHTGDQCAIYWAGIVSSAVNSAARAMSLYTGALADNGTGCTAILMTNIQGGGFDQVRSLRAGASLGGVNSQIPVAAANASVCTFDGVNFERRMRNYSGTGADLVTASTGAFAFDRGGWGVSAVAAAATGDTFRWGEGALWLTAPPPAQRSAMLANAAAFWGL